MWVFSELIYAPEGSNYSLMHKIKTNGMSTTKVNNFMTSPNKDNLDLKTPFFWKISHKANDQIRQKTTRYNPSKLCSFYR